MGLREDIAGRLTEARKKSDLDRKDAAEALGLPYQTYAAHENGNRTFDVEAAVAYSRRFKVSVEWLLTGRGRGPGGTEDTAPAVSQPSAATAFPPVEPGDRKALRKLINQIKGLKPDNIKVLSVSVEGFWSVNGVLPAPSPLDDQSERANFHHE